MLNNLTKKFGLWWVVGCYSRPRSSRFCIGEDRRKRAFGKILGRRSIETRLNRQHYGFRCVSGVMASTFLNDAYRIEITKIKMIFHMVLLIIIIFTSGPSSMGLVRTVETKPIFRVVSPIFLSMLQPGRLLGPHGILRRGSNSHRLWPSVLYYYKTPLAKASDALVPYSCLLLPFITQETRMRTDFLISIFYENEPTTDDCDGGKHQSYLLRCHLDPLCSCPFCRRPSKTCLWPD